MSVIIVTWNRVDLLRSCLQSLARQNFNQPFGVVIVDNGSTDGTAEMVLTEFGESTKFSSKLRIKLIQNLYNRGFCAANNQGFAASESEFVALLNNDAEAHPDWLSNLATAFEGRPDVGMAASKILVFEFSVI